MAMAIRSMLGKLRNKSSSSCIDRKSMPIMLASSSSINNYQKNRYELLSKPSSTCGSGYSSPRPFHEIKKLPPQKEEVKVYQAVVYESENRRMLESEMESDSKKTRRMALILFGLVVDNGNLLKLIDRRKVEVREVPPLFQDEVTLYTDDRGNKTEL
ncbi:hypothetical protein M0R45_033998 [Rubus argutus]|uniref:Uncharacterized protein n=1 Tax=Rubus argutus TaxID=59490 RepID=A0AAW1VPU0_RUBAR